MKNKKIIVIVLVLVVLFLIGTFSNDSTENNTNTPNNISNDNTKQEINSEKSNDNKINEAENNSKEISTNKWKILHGELLSLNENCRDYTDDFQCLGEIVVIKAKIKQSYNNKATIDQNYYNVEDFIKNNNGSKYEEIQYWAVADMESGIERKVISFTVNKDIINKIKNDQIVANQLGNYLDDLWIINSLKS